MKTIAAVVVTFNRADLLDQVITHLSEQSRRIDCLIIVDNASTDHTQKVIGQHISLGRINIDNVVLSRNIGGAGGFYHGAKKAYQDGYSAVWFMDDDTMPQKDALEHLVTDLVSFEKDTEYRPAFICSTVLWKNNDLCEMNIPKPIWDWPRFLFDKHRVALVECCSFVSVLVRREKIKVAGYPFPNFFIWYDDVEYTKRLSQAGYPGLLSVRSKVNHYLAENKGVNYSMITTANSWKYRFGIRNEAAVILRDHGFLRYIYFGIHCLREAYRCDISGVIKVELFKAFLSAYKFKIAIEYPAD